tara:strand:+ start:166 stop:774 length:609 start_codon:yes stop_codon:yes gene_type:complete
MSYDAVKALLSRGISRPTLYQVIMPLSSREANNQLEFLCSKAAVPPVSVQTITVSGQESLGVEREQPVLISFNSPFTITVISDRDYTVYKSIKEWLNLVSTNANPNTLGGFAGQSQRISYYNTFRRNIILKKLEQQGGRGSQEVNSYSEPFRIEFNNAFPVNLGEITLSTDDYDSKVEFTVDFAYETYSFIEDFGRTINGLI